MANPRKRGSGARYPFLFLGAGFGTSRKCLEGMIWFERSPSVEERAAVEGLLPPALAFVKRWAGSVLGFGSDDALEWHVAKERDGAPTKTEWLEFCESFERRVCEMNALVPVVLVLKDDDGAYGRKRSPWHDWSLRELAQRCDTFPFALAASSKELGPSCVSILRAIATSEPALASMTPEARRSLGRFGAGLIEHCNEHTRPRIVDVVLSLLAEEELEPELVDALFRQPTVTLARRIGGAEVVRRARAWLDAATPDDAEWVLRNVVDWMVHAGDATLALGEALLACPALSAVVAEHSAGSREDLASGRGTRKCSPSLALLASGGCLLDMHGPAAALRCFELALRFPSPPWEIHGSLVRALHGSGQTVRARELAESDFLLQQVAPNSPRVLYELARYYIHVGAPERAIVQLKRYVHLDPTRAGLLRSDPRVAPLRAFREFETLFSRESDAEP